MILTTPPALDSSAEEPVTFPCLIGRRPGFTYACYEISAGPSSPIARLGRAPRLMQFQMLDRAAFASPALRRIPDGEWMSLLDEAGEIFARGEGASYTAGLVSISSGLPRSRVLKAYGGLAANLARMREILSAQAPAGDRRFYCSQPTENRSWRPIPRGRHLGVRIPGNFPTININWLISLAARRPVLLCASLSDPFTAYRLAKCLYDAGAPDYSISLCYQEAELFWERADQVLMSGDPPPALRQDPSRVHLYHHGHCKTVISGTRMSQELAERLALQSAQGCGRLCTNLSAVLLDEAPATAAEEIASAMAKFPILPLDDPQAIVPSFPDRQTARRIASHIAAAVQRGARDVTADISSKPLVLTEADSLFLRPTVLLANADDPIFGEEFPFPFVVVARAPASEFVKRCRNSLIVSVIGGNSQLLEDLIYEPTIDKVFWGKEFDRAYDPAEPHEGFLADFLFRKKVVSNYD